MLAQLRLVSPEDGCRAGTGRGHCPTRPLTATETMRWLRRTFFYICRSSQTIGAVAFERAHEKSRDPLVDLLAQPADLALGDARAAHRLDEVADRAGRDALHVGLE